MTAVPAGTDTGAGITGAASVTGGTTRVAGFWQSPTVRRGAADLGAVVVLLAIGVQAFGPVFGSHVGYVAAGGGVVLGLGIALLSRRRGWTRLGTLLAGMIGYLLLGGPLALPATTVGGVVPTLETLQRLTLLSWQSWRDLLTVALPAGEFDGPAVLPFLVGLVTSTLAGCAVLRLRQVRWLLPATLLPALLFLVIGILWGGHAAPLATLQGALFAGVALAWTSWRTQLGDVDTHAIFLRTAAARGPKVRQTVTSAVALLAAAALAGGAWAVLAGEPDRHVLRDDVVPPLDLRDYASPLTHFRYLEGEQEKDTLFTVDGLPQDARIRLAAMDLYDGNVYNVTEHSAAFTHTGRTIVPGEDSDPDAHVTELTFTVEEYDGVWLPGGGDLRGVEFTGDDAEAEHLGLYYNPATGTALTTGGIGAGTSYTVDVALPPPYTPDERADLPSGAEPDTDYPVPSDLARVEAASGAMGDLAGDAETAMDQLRAIENALSTQGFFADGSPDPSFAGHTVERIRLLLEDASGQMVGDDEQYAVAMSLMARELGLPSRVVMGFYPDPEVERGDGPVAITGDDAHVWVEVRFEELGWVPFDPTPPEDQRPEQNQPEPEPRNEPQVLPPPEVPEDRDVKPPPRTDSDVDKDDTLAVALRILLIVGVVVGSLSLLMLPFLLIGLLKRRRRHRRRTHPRIADRISGGWHEVEDLALDAGAVVPAGATRWETAVLALDRVPPATGTAIAERVDAHVFGSPDPTEDDAADVWGAVDDLRREMLRASSPAARFRTRFSLRSLLHRRPGQEALLPPPAAGTGPDDAAVRDAAEGGTT